MEREEAITTLKEMHDSFDEIHENTNGDIGYEQMTAIDMAIKAPQTDLVRCKDCKYCWYDEYTDSLECKHCNGLTGAVYGNDFCCYGERREP